MRTHIFFVIACILSVMTLTHCQQPSEPTAEDVQRYLLASRWYADTTKNSYFGSMPLCPSGIGGFDILHFTSPTTVVTTGRDGKKQEQSWELQTVLFGPNPRQGIQLHIGGKDGREYPILYCNRDTLILGTPWLDADCSGFRMLAQAK